MQLHFILKIFILGIGKRITWGTYVIWNPIEYKCNRGKSPSYSWPPATPSPHCHPCEVTLVFTYSSRDASACTSMYKQIYCFQFFPRDTHAHTLFGFIFLDLRDCFLSVHSKLLQCLLLWLQFSFVELHVIYLTNSLLMDICIVSSPLPLKTAPQLRTLCLSFAVNLESSVNGLQ